MRFGGGRKRSGSAQALGISIYRGSVGSEGRHRRADKSDRDFLAEICHSQANYGREMGGAAPRIGGRDNFRPASINAAAECGKCRVLANHASLGIESMVT